MKTAAKYGAGLVALYLLVAWGTNSGTLINDVLSGVATDTKAFQGR